MESAVRAAVMPTRSQSFGVVLAIEFWERFGFYGMQALLLLYLVQQLGLTDRDATLLIGAFTALVYIFPVLGGIAGDRLLGARRCMVLGAILLTAGYLLLGCVAYDRVWLTPAMALISTGNGLFKPNMGNIVRRIYEGDDAELDAAFTLYYMAVNIGSSVSMLLAPVLQVHFGPSVAFFICAGGLVIGLAYYAFRADWVAARDGPLDRVVVTPRAIATVGAGIAASLAAAIAVLGNATVARDCIWGAGVLILLAWGTLYRRADPTERIGLRIAYLLCAETMGYALFFQQQATSLTLFALRGVDGDFRIGGITLFHMTAGQFQALDAIGIMVASPVLAALYRALARRGRDLTLAAKLAAGFASGTVAFLIWWGFAATAHGLVSGWVMVAGYAFAAVGELLTMGLGLAVVARYVPARFSGFMIGSLYLLWALAFYLGSVLASGVPSGQAAGSAAAYAPLLGRLNLLIAVVFVVSLALLPLVRHWERRNGYDNTPSTRTV